MAITVKEFIPSVNEKPVVTITSDKFNSGFKITPAKGGFVFYEINSTGGSTPKELSGKYTRIDDAVAAVRRYEHKHTGTAQKQRDIKRAEANAAKVKRASTADVHSGADNGEV